MCVTLFEYLAIAFGLLYSVGALRILGGLPSALDPEKRYWVHTGMSLLMLMGIASSFWAFWSLRETAWTYPGFLLALLLPGLLFYCAAILIPENPEAVFEEEETVLASPNGGFITLKTPAGKAAMLALASAFPKRLSLSEVCRKVDLFAIRQMLRQKITLNATSHLELFDHIGGVVRRIICLCEYRFFNIFVGL